MLWIWLYLGVGGFNAAVAGAEGRLMIRYEHSAEALVEAAFYVLLWPVQMLFWTLVGISSLLDRIGFHVMGGASRKAKPKHRG